MHPAYEVLLIRMVADEGRVRGVAEEEDGEENDEEEENDHEEDDDETEDGYSE